MTSYRILAGLPGSGPPVLSFPDPNAFREGFVVEFVSDGNAGTWVGNFRPHSAYRPNAVHLDLGSSAAVIVAGGVGYMVDCERRRLIRELGTDIEDCWHQPDLGALIISDGLCLEAFDANGTLWRSRRVSWDGISIVERSGTVVHGAGYDPMSDQWQEFQLNVLDGTVEGGERIPFERLRGECLTCGAGAIFSVGDSPSSACRHLLPAGGAKGICRTVSVPLQRGVRHVPSPRKRGEG